MLKLYKTELKRKLFSTMKGIGKKGKHLDENFCWQYYIKFLISHVSAARVTYILNLIFSEKRNGAIRSKIELNTSALIKPVSDL